MPKVDIWMPIFIGDYLSDTTELTAAEHGVYLLLLMHYWSKKGEIGSDIERLARVCRSDIETCSFILGYYFTLENGNYKNRRADKEMEIAESRRLASSENGKKGGRPLKNNLEKTDGFSVGNLEESSSPSPLPIPIPIHSEKEEGSSRIEKLKKHWNESKAGPECRLLSVQFRPEDASDCLRTMSVYTDDEIQEAMDTYCKLRDDPTYDCPRYQSFVGFMKSGVEKFIQSVNPQEFFRLRKKFESAAEREERERAESIARLEAMP